MRRSEALARYKNEKHAECNVDKECDAQNHDGSLVNELADEGLPDPGVAHPCVLAESGHADDWI